MKKSLERNDLKRDRVTVIIRATGWHNFEKDGGDKPCLIYGKHGGFE